MIFQPSCTVSKVQYLSFQQLFHEPTIWVPALHVLRPILAYDHRARLAYVRDLRPTPRAQFLLTTSTMCRTNDVGLIYTDTIYRVVMMHASRARYIVLSKNRTVDIN